MDNKIFKLIIIIFLLVIPNLLFPQNENDKYKYYITVSTLDNLPIFTKQGDFYYYNGQDERYSSFFNSYTIHYYELAFPKCPFIECPYIFEVIVSEEKFIDELFNNFPEVYIEYEDISHINPVIQHYPNDYGTTSPFSNWSPFERRELDYIGAPHAWDITTGTGLKFGLSDARIKGDDPEFINKFTFVGNTYYQDLPYDPNDQYTSHGTSVGALAVAQGDNLHGLAGICYDCDLVATRLGMGSLFYLIDEGVKVINMSWVNSVAGDGYSVVQENLIKKIVDTLGITLVAAAGNFNSFQTNNDFFDDANHCKCENGQLVPRYTGIQYRYPASYDGVISVSTISHYYKIDDPAAFNSNSPWGFPILDHVENSVAGNVNGDTGKGLLYNGWPRTTSHPCNPGQITSPNGLVKTNTLNDEVDIVSVGVGFVPIYGKYAEESIILYGGATSNAAPFVSGTAALMKSYNDCLSPREIDMILKLTSKDVEHMPLNELYYGVIGAGSLMTGDAVEFVHKMKSPLGQAIIKDHIFYRYKFKLEKFNNRLVFSNVTFKDSSIVDFTVRNKINLYNTHLKPNENGYIHLKVDANVDICSPMPWDGIKSKSNENIKAEQKTSILYPNPNEGIFSILTQDLFYDEIYFKIYSVNGMLVYEESFKDKEIKDNIFTFNLLNLVNGIYFVTIQSTNHMETIKFIKK